jgi:hypothetical protein
MRNDWLGIGNVCSQKTAWRVFLSILLTMPHLGSAQAAIAPVVSQVVAAFSAQTVSSVQISGTATWYAGGLTDAGNALLTANSNGSAQMQLSLNSKGQWTESQTAVGTSMSCGWIGNDAVQHTGNLINCLRPVVWFIPPIFLQSLTLTSTISVTDLGVGPIASAGSYRHLHCFFSTFPDPVTESAAAENPVEIGVDPNTFFPAVVSYQVQPDNGANVLIPIEIRLSNYNQVNGVQVPYLIQRYVNGALQVSIQVTSVQVN